METDDKVNSREFVCEDCDLAKARRKHLNKFNSNPATYPGERLYIDLSWVKEKSGGDSEYWLLTVDEMTSMFWSSFLKHKSDLAEEETKLIKKLQNERITEVPKRCNIKLFTTQ